MVTRCFVNTFVPLLPGWYAHSFPMAYSFPTCDPRDSKRCTDASGERLRSILHLLRGIGPRFVLGWRGLSATTDLTDLRSRRRCSYRGMESVSHVRQDCGQGAVRRSSSQDYRRDGASGRTVPGFDLPKVVASTVLVSPREATNSAKMLRMLPETSWRNAWWGYSGRFHSCAAEQCCR